MPVRVPPELRAELEVAAKREGVSLSEFVRRAASDRAAAGNAVLGIDFVPPAAKPDARPVGACPRASSHRPGVHCKECGA